MDNQDLVLAPGTRLIHIGPHKTGTTTIQGAFHLGREKLAEHGVVYAGSGRQPWKAVYAVTGWASWGLPSADMSDWTRLCREVNDAGDKRVVVSSERFAQADDDTARRIVRELGGSRAHVVVTLRPLTKILPSQWQQYAQEGLDCSYQDWLRGMLDKPPYDRPTPSFWKRHRHDELIQRWAQAAGPENVTVIVVDGPNPRMLPDTFESLLGLPEGVLVPEEGRANRSLTIGEAELSRLLIEEFKQKGWPEEVYRKQVRHGAISRLRAEHQPLPSEPKATTPAWALERASKIGAEMAGNISALGVRVVGDLSMLSQPESGPEEVSDPEPLLSAAAAAQAVLGAIAAGGTLERPAKKKADSKRRPARPEDRPVREVDARTLLRVVASRVRRRVRRKLRRGA